MTNSSVYHLTCPPGHHAHTHTHAHITQHEPSFPMRPGHAVWTEPCMPTMRLPFPCALDMPSVRRGQYRGSSMVCFPTVRESRTSTQDMQCAPILLRQLFEMDLRVCEGLERIAAKRSGKRRYENSLARAKVRRSSEIPSYVFDCLRGRQRTSR